MKGGGGRGGVGRGTGGRSFIPRRAILLCFRGLDKYSRQENL